MGQALGQAFGQALSQGPLTRGILCRGFDAKFFAGCIV